MKKILTMFSFIILITGMVKAQEIDFLNRQPVDLKKEADFKSVVKIKINNVNRFLYKVSSTKTETDFNVTVPKVLSGITLPGFLNTQLPVGSGAAPSLFKSGDAKTTSGWMDDFKSNVKFLDSTQKLINSAVDLHNRVVDISRDCEHDFKTVIEKNANKELKDFVKAADGLTIDVLALKIRDILQDRLDGAIGLSNSIESQYENWTVSSRADYQSEIGTKKGNILELKNEWTNLQAQLKKSKTTAEIARITKSILKNEKAIHDSEIDLSNSESDYEKSQEMMNKMLEKAVSLLSDLNKFREDGKLFALIDDLRKVNESNYSFYTEEVEIKKDEVKFDITITANELLTCNKPNEEKFTVKVKTIGGVKLDFSTGLFFNFGSKKFLGQDFYYCPIDSSHTQIQIADRGKNIGLSLGALMHIYCRSKSNTRFGAVVGASVSTGLDAMNFHVGPSLMFGGRDRFCISGGLTFREVKELDTKFEAGKSYETILLPEEIPLVKTFPKVGYFISLTYNFSKFNKE